MRNKIYFFSDVHLGSIAHQKSISEQEKEELKAKGIDIEIYAQHQIERKLCRWLDKISNDAKAIYLMGDIFDYWFEYKYVVPRGFSRFIGKLAQLSDMGIEMHYFIGNHDIWLTNYLEKECGMMIHREAIIDTILGKKFYLAHGDGLGDNSKSFKLLRSIFHNKFCRFLYAGIHPRWTMGFAHRWSNGRRASEEAVPYLGEENEHLVKFSKKQLEETPDIDFFIFGHRHIMLDLMLSSSRITILGDWFNYYSYAVFDGENFALEIYEE